MQNEFVLQTPKLSVMVGIRFHWHQRWDKVVEKR